jgi:hypothetical protein
MDLVNFMFGLSFGLTIALFIVALSLYSLLSATIPPDELRAFVREARLALRSFTRRRNRSTKK